MEVVEVSSSNISYCSCSTSSYFSSRVGVVEVIVVILVTVVVVQVVTVIVEWK